MTMPRGSSQSANASWPGGYVSSRVNARQVVRASYETSILTFEEYSKQAIAFAESGPERARRALTQRRLDILRDAWGPLLVAALDNWLKDEVRELVIGQSDEHLDLSRNPAKHIWQELAMLYKLPPMRSTRVGGEETGDDEKYTALLVDTDFDIWWQLVELLLNTCNEVVIWPDVIERNGKKVIKHRVSTGANLTAITTAKDSTEIECWVVITDDRDLADAAVHRHYRIWTDNWHGEFEKGEDGNFNRTDLIDPDVVTEELDDSPSSFTVVNPYGKMPMIRIRLNPWPDVVWDQTSGEDLVDLNIHGGVNRQFFRYLEKVAGFKQGVLTGDFDKDLKVILDPGFLIKLQGDNANCTVIDWSVNLLDRLKCMDIDEQAAAAAKGINPQRYKRETDYQTGVGAKHAERGLAEYRERNRPILLRAEREYYRMLCVVAAAHRLDPKSIPNPDAKLNVDFQPLAFPADPIKQLEVDSKEISLGLESHKTILRRKHPDWTVEQVDRYLEEVMAAIAYVNDMKTRHQIPSNPENESAGAEEDGAQGPVVRDGRQPPPGSQPGE